MPLQPVPRSRRDSWPPTQVRVSPVVPLEDLGEDPLNYFLTPAPAVDDMGMDYDIMDFDAGIEDSNRPPEIVRSVSPSSLDGLRRRKDKKALTEPELSDGPSPYEDDSEEEYIRFQPGPLGLPFGLRDFAIDGLKSKARKSGAAPLTGDVSLSPPTIHVSGNRGRTPARGLGHGRARSLSARRRQQRLWREPSPDVWSIEEETEADLNSEMGSSVAPSENGDEPASKDEDEEETKTKKQLEVRAAKPFKKVRFVLPAKE